MHHRPSPTRPHRSTHGMADAAILYHSVPCPHLTQPEGRGACCTPSTCAAWASCTLAEPHSSILAHHTHPQSGSRPAPPPPAQPRPRHPAEPHYTHPSRLITLIPTPVPTPHLLHQRSPGLVHPAEQLGDGLLLHQQHLQEGDMGPCIGAGLERSAFGTGFRELSKPESLG